MKLFKRKEIPQPEVVKTDYLPLIKGIYNEEMYGEYAGVTLCIKEQMYTEDGKAINGGNELHLLPMSKEDLTVDERFWLAMCYIKYKAGGSKTKEAYNIVRNYEDKNTSVKALLNV